MEEGKKAIHEMAVETRLLLQRIKTMAEGEVVPYTELAQIASCDVRRGRGYGCLGTARKRAQVDHGIIIDAVWKVGVKRIAPQEMPELGRKNIAKIRHASKRTMKKLSATDFTKLNREESASVLAQVSVLGFIAHCAKDSEVKKIEPLVRDQNMELPVGRTLEAFREKS